MIINYKTKHFLFVTDPFNSGCTDLIVESGIVITLCYLIICGNLGSGEFLL